MFDEFDQQDIPPDEDYPAGLRWLLAAVCVVGFAMGFMFWMAVRG